MEVTGSSKVRSIIISEVSLYGNYVGRTLCNFIFERVPKFRIFMTYNIYCSELPRSSKMGN